MDDLIALNLPREKTIQVQSVRLYLKVSVLSEITNHGGTHLLPRAMRHSQPTPNNPYTTCNHSRLVWPHQPAPGPKAWSTWTKVLNVLYLQPNSHALSQPLGEWLPAYATDYNWVWRICPKSYILFHQHNGKWIAFTQRKQHPTHVHYHLHTSNTSDPSGTVPVTPLLLSNSIHIQLPITPIWHNQPPPTQSIPLATRLTTPDTAWTSNLWHDLRPHTHSDQLREAIINNNRIVVVSDAAVHNTGQATCAWIIWSKKDLWSGEGYVPGHHDDTNSGVAEAYGVATALRFLHQYTRLYPLALPTQRNVHVYCDNQGVIERINNYGTNLYPRDTIRDDYVIYANIEQHVSQLKPIHLVFQHVKGHQDNKRDHVMTTPE